MLNLRKIKRQIVLQLHRLRDFFDTYIAFKKVVETPFGFSMLGGSSQHHKAMQKGIFELTEVTWLKEQADHFDVFVDIGANIGYFTCLARSMGKRVIAIEPFQLNSEILLRNIEMNKGSPVEVFPVALSSEVHTLRLYGASSTGASLINNWAGASTLVSRLVPVSTLDILLSGRFFNEKLLIKVDVEGAEFDLLRGALDTIQRSLRPTWLVEITMGQFMPEGVNRRFIDTFALFMERGYSASLLTDQGLLPITKESLAKWQSQGYSDYDEFNYVFS